MASDALEFLLRGMDETAPVWDGVAIAGWPAGRFERLQDLGLLKPGPVTTHVVCPNCAHDHVEPVTYVGDQPHVLCAEGGAVKLEPELLRTWMPDRAALAALLKQVMKVADRFSELVPGRLWQLGSVQLDGAKRKVMLAIGLHWADGEMVARSVGRGGKPVLLVPTVVPDQSIWAGLLPPVGTLADILLDDGLSVRVDQAALLGVIREADDLNKASREGVLADPKLRRMLGVAARTQVKSNLDHDVLIGAYKAFGTYDKAAEALTAQLGRKVSRDSVFRAVQAAGGIAAVKRTESSDSVQRRIASQRRDRAKKKQ